MATIQELLELDINKIQPTSLQKSVKDILEDYEKIEAKEIFEKEAAANIDKIYMMVTKVAPKALPSNPCDDPSEEKPNKKSKASVKKRSKISNKKTAPQTSESANTASKKDIDKAMEEIRQCRLKIKKYNEEKRKEEGPKPQPTRYAKIKGHIISLGNLIPKGLKNDMEAQKEANRLLRNTHRSLLKIYKMTAIKGQKDNQELKERYEKIEEKLEK